MGPGGRYFVERVKILTLIAKKYSSKLDIISLAYPYLYDKS